MYIPLRCEAITIKDGCVLRISKPGGREIECEWDGNKCIDKSCITAPSYLTSD